MIPARPAAPPPRSKESISDKISRLRREDHAASRPRLHHAPPQPSSSAPRWLAAATDHHPPPSRRPRTSDPRRGTPGPAPPPSWTASPASTSTDLSLSSASSSSHDPRRRTTLRPRDLVERRKLVQSLVAVAPSSSSSPRPSVDSLFALAGGVLAADLSRARAPPAHNPSSLLLEHVAYLPNHVRVRLVNEVFADSRNPAPLTDEGARELLRTDVSDGIELEVGGEVVEGELGRLRIDEADEEGGGWEDDALAAQDSHLVELVDVLDLSFAHVSLRALRSLLLRPVGPALPPPAPPAPSQPRLPLAAPSPAPSPPPKLVSAFPHLHTLTLTATPRLALAEPLFDLLAHLVSLRHLSLAGKHLDGHHPSSSSATTTSSSATAASLLPRLAAATPTLRTLDLSYLAGLVVDAPSAAQGLVGAVRGVDWDARWGELRVLGVRGAVDEREGEGDEGDGTVREARECVRREVREVVMLGRQRKKRRWIDVVV